MNRGPKQRPRPKIGSSNQENSKFVLGEPYISSSVRSQGPSNPNQQDSGPASSSTSGDSQFLWPKMKPSEVQKYTKVFRKVDIDRDGKITGEEAQNLFLKLRLPREVSKQVWELSDQDKDSKLSLREFCYYLYLWERYREGRPLPDTLPHNVMHDETLLGMEGLNTIHLGNGKQDSANSKPEEPKDTGKKVEETENVILDSKREDGVPSHKNAGTATAGTLESKPEGFSSSFETYKSGLKELLADRGSCNLRVV